VRAVVCDACSQDHVADVIIRQGEPGRETQAYLRCPEAGRVPVPLERLQRWVVDFGCLAAEASKALDLAGDVEEVSPGRVWVLGNRTFDGRSLTLLLVRGLGWTDGTEVLDDILHSRGYGAQQVVILVPGVVPSVQSSVEGLRIVPLARLLSLDVGEMKAASSVLGPTGREKRSRSPAGATASFPTPRGTRWGDVEIGITDFNLKVTIKDRSKVYTFIEAGFEDRRRGEVPNKLWVFLRVLATQGGTYPVHRNRLSGGDNSLKQSICQLRKALRQLLNIESSPFRYLSQPPRYEALFRIHAGEGLSLSIPPGTNWDQVSILETSAGTIRISADHSEVFPDYVIPEEGSGAGKWQAGQRVTEQGREYNLRALGLAAPDGSLLPVGEALLDVLRGNGRVSRPERDPHMLALGAVLGHWLQIDGPAFQFVRSKKTWVSVFEATSQVGGRPR